MEIIDARRDMYSYLVYQESICSLPKFPKHLRGVMETLGPFDRLERYGKTPYYLCVDRHATGRFNARVLERFSEEEIKQHRVTWGCEPETADVLMATVKGLLNHSLYELLMNEDAPVVYDEESGKIVPTREDGLSVFVVGFARDRDRYVLCYSYTTIFVLTVVTGKNVGTDWPHAKVILL